MGSPFAPNYVNLLMREKKKNYLDLWILKENDTLHTDLYTKPTDRNSLLRVDSMHPLPLKNGLPYSQLCRVKRICGHQSYFDSNAKKMTDTFKMRGYKDKTLDAAMMKISQKPREELLKTKPKKKNNATVFCTKYTKCLEKIKAILKKRWHILCKSTDYPVAAHFVEANHPISSLKYTGIEHVALPKRGGNIDILLLQREAYWISYLKTLTPS
ncbi:unnamed protein product, partial [Coregonus sp. 'balchen']